MHNRSVTRAGATSSYKLVAETVLVVAILRAMMLVIGTSLRLGGACLALGACCVALGAD